MASADLRPEQATDDRGGGQTAATGIMSWLTWLPRLVALHLAWSVMVLLGGVVIGIAPATVTLVTVLRGQNEFARATGSRALAAAVWARYRREVRSEERRVGKECRSRWGADDEKQNGMDESRLGAGEGVEANSMPGS